jgi:hydrogenase expression/formation protein HypE
MAVLAARDEFHFTTTVESDCAPLWGLVEVAVAATRDSARDSAPDTASTPAALATAPGSAVALRFLRDPTRGGLTTVLAELAESASLGVEIEERAIPVSAAVRSICDLLGYEPLSLANEGKMVFVVAPEKADAVVAALRAHPLGRHAARIGSITAAHPGRVALRTVLGTRRVLDMPVGELLPRIC